MVFVCLLHGKKNSLLSSLSLSLSLFFFVRHLSLPPPDFSLSLSVSLSSPSLEHTFERKKQKNPHHQLLLEGGGGGGIPPKPPPAAAPCCCACICAAAGPNISWSLFSTSMTSASPVYFMKAIGSDCISCRIFVKVFLTFFFRSKERGG